MSHKTTKENEQKEAILELRKLIRPGQTVYTVLRHVSSSGMMRHIDVFIVRKNEPRRIAWTVARALGDTLAKDGGIKQSGCGMDMGFNLVYNLGRTLFPKGFVPSKAGKGYGRNGSPATERDTDGGYGLNQKWL